MAMCTKLRSLLLMAPLRGGRCCARQTAWPLSFEDAVNCVLVEMRPDGVILAVLDRAFAPFEDDLGAHAEALGQHARGLGRAGISWRTAGVVRAWG
jgi:hypothetical protein